MSININCLSGYKLIFNKTISTFLVKSKSEKDLSTIKYKEKNQENSSEISFKWRDIDNLNLTSSFISDSFLVNSDKCSIEIELTLNGEDNLPYENEKIFDNKLDIKNNKMEKNQKKYIKKKVIRRDD